MDEYSWVYWILVITIINDYMKALVSETGTNDMDHNSDVIMSEMASQITIVAIVCSNVCSGADQRKGQSSASLAFVWGIHRWPVNSPHKGQ